MDINEAKYDAADLQLIAAMRSFTLSQTNREQLAEGDKRNSFSLGLRLLWVVTFGISVWGAIVPGATLIFNAGIVLLATTTMLIYLKAPGRFFGIRRSLGITRKRAHGIIPGDRALSSRSFWQNLLPGIPSSKFYFSHCYSFFTPDEDVPSYLVDLHPNLGGHKYYGYYKELFVVINCGGAPSFNEVVTRENEPNQKLLDWLGTDCSSTLQNLRKDLIITFVDGNIVVSGYGDEEDIWIKDLSTRYSWSLFTETVSGPMADLVEALVLTRGVSAPA
ncbi:MAG: hypothetical protein ACKOWK_02655 [Micrococcales bacterium]